jgi:ankyrin repeat protein
MRKIIYLFLLFFLSFSSCFAQENLDVFDIARKGTVEQAKGKVKENPNSFNVVNEEGYSPFLLACYRSNNEVAKYLMNIGCDVNSKSKFGTPLMACIVKSNNEIAKVLIFKKVDLDFADLSGMTALIYAINFKNYEIVSALVKAGVNTDYKDGKGKTALDYAILMDDDLLIELLKNKNKKL